MDYLSNIQVNGKSIPIGGGQFDGQWVYKQTTLSTATAIGTYVIDLSDYLPNDEYNYEIICSDSLNNDSSTDTKTYANDILMLRVNSSNVKCASSCVIPTTGRTINYSIKYCKLTAHQGFLAHAYRRIGTNE